MKGLIFSIKRYSIHDGPGIRVTFFMKGCPLSCKWCHNPEGILPQQESVVNSYRVGAREFCRNEEAGKHYSVEEIIALLERDRVFMDQSNGGVTFSGGEPMFQFAFLYNVIKSCKELGYHTTIDTSGYSPAENFKTIIPFTDLFLFDLKHLDDRKHLEATGVSNTLIIGNYELLLKNAREVALRIPIIPGFNDDQDHIERLIKYIITTKTDSLKMINLLPFHKIGSSKYPRLNLPYRMGGVEPPSKTDMQELKNHFLGIGVKVKIGG
jgi:pyruvate formate lyase activating enzyme